MPPKGFTTVGKLSRLGAGELMLADVAGSRVLVANVDGEVFAVAEECPHAGGPLCEGTLTGDTVECPWHGSVFDVKTGKVKEGPATEDLTAYEAMVEGDDICVGPARH